jgi:hypothetical protein
LDNIRDFIYPEVEKVINLEKDITSQIIEHYSLSEKDQAEEVSVEDVVRKVLISEAINALIKISGQKLLCIPTFTPKLAFFTPPLFN